MSSSKVIQISAVYAATCFMACSTQQSSQPLAQASTTLLSAASLHQLYQTAFVDNAATRQATLEDMRTLPIDTYYKAMLAQVAVAPQSITYRGVAAAVGPDYLQASAATFRGLAATYKTFGAYWDAVGFEPAAQLSETKFTGYVAAAFSAYQAKKNQSLSLVDTDPDFQPLDMPLPADGQPCLTGGSDAAVYPDANTAPAGTMVLYNKTTGGRLGILPDSKTPQQKHIDQLEALLAGDTHRYGVQAGGQTVDINKYVQPAPYTVTNYLVSGPGNFNWVDFHCYDDGNLLIQRNNQGTKTVYGQHGQLYEGQ